jgi:hypothetical protein
MKIICNCCGAKTLAGKINQSLLSCESSNTVQWTRLCVLFSVMSSVKRDRDLGREFESGASKRKIKAELERKSRIKWVTSKIF